MALPSASAAPSDDDIAADICARLQKFNPNGLALSAETDIASELSIDSMAMMEMIFSLEERFDVSIPLNRLGDVRTVSQLAALVREMKAGA